MKIMGFFSTFFFCILLLPVLNFGVQKGDSWSNSPFIKRSAGQKKTPARDGKRNSRKTSELKKSLAWYKKPAALYAAGGVASAALGAYAIFKYMQGEEVVLIPEGASLSEPNSDDVVDFFDAQKQENQSDNPENANITSEFQNDTSQGVVEKKKLVGEKSIMKKLISKENSIGLIALGGSILLVCFGIQSKLF